MTQHTSVIIVGAGPTGLMLAIELGRRGVATILLSENLATSRTPRATVTQARTMEHFRRLGLAEQVRSTGVPGDHATDIVYCSRITWHEIARYCLPSPNEARRMVREDPWRWHTPELTHRSSQMWIEPILLEECRRLPSVAIRLGWRAHRFVETSHSVVVEAERVSDGRKRTVRGSFLVGCDGAASTVRARLGIGRGESSEIKEFKGRPMFSAHVRAPKFFDAIPFKRGWNYHAINSAQRGNCISLNGAEFKFSFWRPPDWAGNTVTKEKIAKIHYRMFGRECDFTLIDYRFWRGGASLVADSYRRGRIFLAGDAAHLFTPSAGLGYNTGISDAANLGWKLAATINRWGGPALLESYESECRPEALRRTRFAAECAERLAVFKPSPKIDQDTAEGDEARARAAGYFAEHLPFQYNIPGLILGGRFDGSSIIVPDGSAGPPQNANVYVPSARPGGRAPHLWLPDGRSLFDAFGFEFTLLKLGRRSVSAEPLRQAASHLGIPLTILELSSEPLRDLYQADLVLIRPDQVVAWRGSGLLTDAAGILRKITGWE